MNGAHALLTTAALALAICGARAAGTLQSAEVTRVYNQVDLLVPNQAAAPAKIGDGVTGQTAVQTGGQSRAELQFNDTTIARLGANSVFSFQRGTRDLNLSEGVILLEVPKHAGGANINTAAVTAAVTGTTVMIESRKGADGKPIVKFIVLEGTMRIQLKGAMGESILLQAGQMVTFRGDARHIPDPQIIDIGRLTKTSGLMSDQFPPLKNQPYILQTMSQQRILKTQGKLIALNYGLYGKRRNPVLQVISNTTQTTALRTDATVVHRPASRPRPANRPAPSRVVHTQPQPQPRPPVIHKPPRPPKQPPQPKPPAPPAPPAVPPSPSMPS